MQHSYLKEMGIDVWVQRESPETRTEAPPANVPSAVEPQFHLCFLNYQTFGICLSLGEGEDVISVSSKRFTDDVALALNGGVRSPGINNLKWPVRGNLDNSQESASSIVLQRFNNLPGVIFVFGKESMLHLPHLQTADREKSPGLGGRQVLVFDSIEQICDDLSAKRELWRRLQRLQEIVPDLVSSKNHP